ncbi:transposase [Cellulosilyticum ruminicola]|uniref:transposase n=1 Tax=Cellulosilyticum ruminicola TaxID=425254 RepID=UPI0006D046EE|nr:transposase [Cellulosilyticum ruminicola]
MHIARLVSRFFKLFILSFIEKVAKAVSLGLLDATTISLPNQVTDDYTGMGDRNAKSALKIQTLYSAVHHSITDFEITSGVTHDTNVLL